MLYYHENQCDETHLDNEPLLRLHNRTELERQQQQQSEANNFLSSLLSCNDEADDSGLFDLKQEAFSSTLSNPMDNNSESSDTEQVKLDENGNVRFSAQCCPTDHPLIHIDPNADIAENLLAIFVVSFDAKLGNLIEWQMPAHLDLKDIEFKAMASGFHLISNDLVYVFSLTGAITIELSSNCSK